MKLNRVPLKNICDISMGQSPAGEFYNENNDGYPMIAGASDFGDLYPSAKKYTTEANKLSKIGDIVLCIRATIGDVNWSDQIYCLGRGVAGLTPHQEKLNSNYLWHFLISDKNTLCAKATGSTFKQVSKNHIEEWEIPVPPLTTQIQIAKILDKSTALIAKRKAQIAELEALVRSVFLEMFGDPMTNPKGWEKGYFSDICIINPKAEKYNDELEVSFVPMQLVSENSFEINYEVRKYSEVKKGFTAFIENDVLFAKITPCMENGKAGIAKNLKNNIGFGSTEFHVFRPKNVVYCSFIYNLIHLPLFRKLSAKHFAGAVGHKRVPKDFIEKFELYLPDFSLCKKFDLIVQKIQSQKFQLQQSLAELETQHQALMQRAFKGELVRE